MCPAGPGTGCRVELCVRQVKFREETSSSKNQCAMVIIGYCGRILGECGQVDSHCIEVSRIWNISYNIPPPWILGQVQTNLEEDDGVEVLCGAGY